MSVDTAPEVLIRAAPASWFEYAKSVVSNPTAAASTAASAVASTLAAAYPNSAALGERLMQSTYEITVDVSRFWLKVSFRAMVLSLVCFFFLLKHNSQTIP